MASVPLNFTPPIDPDIVSMEIYEASDPDGPFTLKLTVPAGTYPNYITYYNFTTADNANDWFSIRWVNSAGAKSDYSASIQGGESTLVGIIVQMVLLRNSGANEIIATQETEAAISEYFNVVDPYSIDPDLVSAKIRSGLANYALARTMLTQVISTASSQTADKWTAGIVSMDSSSGSASKSTSSVDQVKALLELAAKDLGLRFSVVLLMKEIHRTQNNLQLQGVDLTRLIAEFA